MRASGPAQRGPGPERGRPSRLLLDQPPRRCRHPCPVAQHLTYLGLINESLVCGTCVSVVTRWTRRSTTAAPETTSQWTSSRRPQSGVWRLGVVRREQRTSIGRRRTAGILGPCGNSPSAAGASARGDRIRSFLHPPRWGRSGGRSAAFGRAIPILIAVTSTSRCRSVIRSRAPEDRRFFRDRARVWRHAQAASARLPH